MRSIIHWTVCISLSILVACSADGVDRSPESVSRDHAPIIGGIADLGRSYVVGVGDESTAFCTGTLISRRTVITAGHCFGGISRIYFGANIALHLNPTVIQVSREVRDPAFDERTMSHDLTMVHLAADAPSQPAPLLRETMDSTFVGPNFTFVGYGDDGEHHYDVRRVVTFPIGAVGPSTIGGNTGSGPIDESMFYYAIPKKNTCSGDSGGPAFVARQRVERVAGATSYGDADCTVDGVDARTDAPAIAAFIQPMIDQFEGTDPCRADGLCDETCNVNQTLVDPDCAEHHCGADGMCVLSCVDPVDPDCTSTDHCDVDGVCDPSCQNLDMDCAPPSLPDGGAPESGTDDGGTGGSGGSGGSSPNSASSSGDSSSASGTGSSGGAGPSADDSTATTGPGRTDGAEPGPVTVPGSPQEAGGCGCRAAGSEMETEGRLGLGLAIGVLSVWRRRRPRS
jgi:hypothetical protein